jgi:hypothetical protein
MFLSEDRLIFGLFSRMGFLLRKKRLNNLDLFFFDFIDMLFAIILKPFIKILPSIIFTI